jgi:hypothetical protein
MLPVFFYGINNIIPPGFVEWLTAVPAKLLFCNRLPSHNILADGIKT